MAKSAILAVKIIGDSSGATKAMGSAAKSASGFAAKMGAVSGIVQAGMSKAMNAISSSVGAAVSRVDTMNNFPKIMQNLGYSSQDASASIQKMSDKLSGLPTSLDEMAGMTQKLAPLTGGLGKATDLSLALNNALLAGGKGTAAASNAMEQYSQMLAANKVDMASWRSMTDAMPGQMNQLAIAILGAGHNSMDLYESMKDGTTTFGQFNDAILNLNDNGINGFASFSKQAKDATSGIATSAQNMKTAVVRGLGNAIGKVSPFIAAMMSKATQGINSVSNAVSNGLGKAVEYIQNSGMLAAVQGLISSAKATIAPFVDFIKTNMSRAFEAVSQSAGPFIDGLKAGWQGLKDVASPFIDIIGQVADKFSGTSLDDSGWNTVKNAITGVGKALESSGAFVSKYKDWFQALAVTAGTVGGSILAVKGALAAWSAVTKVATAVQAAFNLVMNANPILLAVTAIAALTAGLVYFFTQTKTGQEIWQAFTAYVGTAINGIKTWLAGLGTQIVGLVSSFQSAMASIGSFFVSAVGIAQGAWNGLLSWFGSVPGRIGGFFVSIVSLLSQPFNSARDSARSAWDGLISWFGSVPGRIGGFFSGIANTLTAPFRAAVNGIKSIWNSTVGGFGFDVPDWVPGVGGRSFKIPMLAQGGILRSAGTVMVGEAGPELLTLPVGAQVTPLSRTYGLSNPRTTQSPIVINLTVNGILDGEDGAKKIMQVMKDYAERRQ